MRTKIFLVLCCLLAVSPALLRVSQALRGRFAPLSALDAMQQVLTLMKRYPSNEELGAVS